MLPPVAVICYIHMGALCVLLWTHGDLHGLDLTHRCEATWKQNGLICLLASGFRQAHLCLQQQASSIKTCVHTMQCIFHTDSDLKTRNRGVTLSQHEHVWAEEGTIWWRNSHPDHLPAVSPFYSGQSDLLTAVWSLKTKDPPGSYQSRNL